MVSPLTLLTRIYQTIRHDPLRRYIYLLLWPWFMPVAAYLIFDRHLLVSVGTFASGTLVVLVFSTVANEVDTYLLKRIIQRFPQFHQTVWRLVCMALAFNGFNLLLAEASLRLFDATHFLHYQYNPIQNRWTLLFVFISGIVAAGLVESAYAFMQWRTHQTDRQRLEQDNVRMQLDALKTRINPHFLFNSLNSVSSLIADDPARAEALVDDLSKVYRYMLQANQKPLVELGAERRFLESYGRLLEARYGSALQLRIAISPAAEALGLPPLTLQLLLDHICQHNALSAAKPLCIQIETAGAGRLSVRHNRHPRTVLIDRQLPSPDDIAARYVLLSQERVSIDTTPTHISIGLPLLPVDTVPSAIVADDAPNSSTQP